MDTNTATVPEIEEKPWLTFLKKLAVDIVQACLDEEMGGNIGWRVKDLSPDLVCVEISYSEDDGDSFRAFHMFVSKRYFSRNMVRLQDMATDQSIVMQADPNLILAWLSF